MTTSDKEIKYIDLFCGLGAFHCAFNSIDTTDKINLLRLPPTKIHRSPSPSASSRSKYKCVFACDIDEKIRKIYNENYGIIPEGDINNIDILNMPDFDILCGGFPCQPFSIAGKKEGFADDTKGNLFFSILKIIDVKSPSTIILENVKNLVTINNGETFKIIITELQKRGYFVNTKVVDSKYYNSPQSRQRLFIIGNKTKKYEFPPDPSQIITPVSNIIDITETKFMEYESKYILEKCADVSKSKNKSKNNNCNMLYKLINKQSNKGGRQGERVYSIDSCGPTICASSGGPGAKTGLYYIDEKIRRLNVSEGLKMFGFDEKYKWKNTVKPEEMLFYLGNSIVVDVIKVLLTNI